MKIEFSGNKFHTVRSYSKKLSFVDISFFTSNFHFVFVQAKKKMILISKMLFTKNKEICSIYRERNEIYNFGIRIKISWIIFMNWDLFCWILNELFEPSIHVSKIFEIDELFHQLLHKRFPSKIPINNISIPHKYKRIKTQFKKRDSNWMKIELLVNLFLCNLIIFQALKINIHTNCILFPFLPLMYEVWSVGAKITCINYIQFIKLFNTLTLMETNYIIS
jgi:hypothetical protein